ncbi:uncharacterized protein LOC111992962 [Quercus suber]|uniref:uncharacterized protein LOC111992962 n=1 Tax=Quercus suber TaxID=58331 RepID=UPI000CE1A995|nr:uncharacterized protein LOC112003527 [Quercus suber]
MDGSSLGNPGASGFGGLICDQNGTWICGYAHKVGTAMSVVAKLWDLKTGFYYSQICHYKIVHTFKEGNRCDDAMARRGVTMDSDFVLLSSVPKDMRNLVAFDASEEALPRSIPWPL